MAVNRGWAGMAWYSELGGARAAVVNPSEVRWRRQLLTTHTHNRYLVEAKARAGLTPYTVAVQWAVTQYEANKEHMRG